MIPVVILLFSLGMYFSYLIEFVGIETKDLRMVDYQKKAILIMSSWLNVFGFVFCVLNEINNFPRS